MPEPQYSHKDGPSKGHDSELRNYEVTYWTRRKGDGESQVATARYWAHKPYRDDKQGVFQLLRYLPGDIPHEVFTIPSDSFIVAGAVEDQVTEDNQTQHGPHSNTTDDAPTPQDVPF